MQETIHEKWLWSEIKMGNKRALRQLYLNNYDHLLRFGLFSVSDRSLAKGCINEVFIEVWDKREQLPEVKKVKGYLFIIYKRKLFGKLKENKKRNLKIEENPLKLEYQQSYETILIGTQTKEENKKRIQRALEKLTPRQKELIRRRYFEDQSINEMAAELNISARTIYNTLYAALKILREKLYSSK